MPGDPALSRIGGSIKQPHGNSFRTVLVTQGIRTFALSVQVESVYAVVVTDVTDPAAPFVANQVGWGDLDGTLVSKEIGFVYGLALNTAGTRAYVSHQGKVTALDISALPAVTNVGGGTTALEWNSTFPASATFLRSDGNNLWVTVPAHGLYRLDISNPAALTYVSGPLAIAGDDTRYLPIHGPAVTPGGTHIMALGPPNTAVLMNVTGAPAVLSTTALQAALTPSQVTSAAERAAQSLHVTSTRLYSVEGNASPPAGMSGTNRCTVYVRSIDAVEGGSLASPLLLGHSPFLEPQVIHMQEFTRSGRRYLLCTCCMAVSTQTVQGQTGTWSGRTLIILDVEDPANIAIVGTSGPPFAGNRLDQFNPPYQSYSSVILPDGSALISSYNYGLQVTSLATLTAPAPLSRVLLSGEGRWLARRGNLLMVGDGISTARFYDLTNPESPAFLGNYFSAAQCYQGCIALPEGAPGWAYCAYVTSTKLETVNVANPAVPVLNNVLTMPFSIYGMAADLQGSALLVVWGYSGNNPAWALVDIANPQAPSILVSRSSDAIGEIRSSKAILDGNTLYFSTWGTSDGVNATGGGVRIYDVAIRTAPVLLSTISGGPLLIADMALVHSGMRAFLVTVPRWDAVPTSLVLSRGGLWVYEVTTRSAPALITHITHQALLGSTAQSCIFGGVAVLPGFLVFGEYYQGIEALDVSNAFSVASLGPGHYMPATHFTFGAISDGLDVYAITISDLQIYRSAAVGPPAPPAPPTVLFYFSEVVNAGSVSAEALTNQWIEVRTTDGATLLALATPDQMLNYGSGFYGAPSLPWPTGQQAVMTRFHSGATPDQSAQRVRNILDFVQAID